MGAPTVQIGKGPPLWFKIYVIFGSFMGLFTFLGMGYVYTYGISDVCVDARAYMSDEWVLENCPEPSIKNLAVIQLIASAFQNSHFGFSVAVRSLFSSDNTEDRVVVYGCPDFNTEGRGLVYMSGITENLEISFTRLIHEETPVSDSDYGWSVALTDDHIYIGAPAVGTSDQGRVLISSAFATSVACETPLSSSFQCIATNTGDGLLPASSTAANGDKFGYSLAVDANRLDPDTLLVTSLKSSDNAGSGYATLYDLTASPPTEINSFTDPAADATSWFGFSSALQGDVFAVGAPNHAVSSALHGAVHLFESEAFDQTIEGTVADEAFGFSLAVMGDTLVVGAPGRKCLTEDRLTLQEDYDGLLSAGKVYVYAKNSNDTFVLKQTLTASSDNDACFGSSVDISDIEGNIMIGAPYESDAQGAVYHFTLDAVSDEFINFETFPLEANGVATAGVGSHYGHAVAFDAYDRVAIGLPSADGTTSTGSIYEAIGKGTLWRMNYIETGLINSM